MKNLENVVGLQEMNLQEMEEMNGGILYMLASAYAAYALYKCFEDPSGVLNGVMKCF